MIDGPKRDWQKTRLHFFCGAFIGAGLSLYLWFDFAGENSWPIGAFFILSGTLLMGVLAAVFLDSFWEKFLEWFRWW